MTKAACLPCAHYSAHSILFCDIIYFQKRGKMARILFVSQDRPEKRACGVYLIGEQYYHALSQYSEHTIYRSLALSTLELKKEIFDLNPDIVLVNYHEATVSWIDMVHLRKVFHHTLFAKIEHDFTEQKISDYYEGFEQKYQFAICLNTTLEKSNPYVFCCNRLMSDGIPDNYIDIGIPKIGYQGFGFDHKGILKIAQRVIHEFDEAIIRLHIPFSFYGDPEGHLARARIQEVEDAICNTKIKLEYSHELISSEEMVKWLSQNTVNCYFYDETNQYGVASAPDYAMAARRPIAVNDTYQLQYIHKNVPSANVLQNGNSLRKIINNEFAPFNDLYDKMKPQNVVAELDHIFNCMMSA